ncbi:hypothetical protein BDR04DRAFT_936602, partial [Suillus decipiens]
HLHCIARAPTATCPGCQTHEESVHHFLMACSKYARQQATLGLEVGLRRLNVKYLLSEGKGIRATLKYI